MKKKFIVSTEIEVEISNNKITDTLKDFKYIIDDNATLDDIFKRIALNKATGNSFSEGIGIENKSYTTKTFGYNINII